MDISLHSGDQLTNHLHGVEPFFRS